MGGVAAGVRGLDGRGRTTAAAGASCTRRSTRRSAGRSATARYAPMVELLRYLEANGFTIYIASGGDRDFMRAGRRATSTASRPSGSSAARTRSRYREDEHGGSVVYQAEPGRLRRRPGEARAHLEPDRPPADPRRAATPTATSRCCASPAAPARPALRLLVLHDDAEREFDYTARRRDGARRGRRQGWTVVSIKDDWATVFASRLMGQAIGQILPFAVGVGLSPVPIIAVVVMLATPRARANGPAFLLGWLVGLAVVGTSCSCRGRGRRDRRVGEPATWVERAEPPARRCCCCCSR